MLLSLIVYVGTALILYLLMTNYVHRNRSTIKRYNKELPFASFEIVFSLLLFSLVAGMRYNTGVDYMSYWEDYFLISKGAEPYHDYEGGFMVLMSSLARNGVHYSVFFGLCGFLQLFFVFYALRDNKYLLPYVSLYIMMGPLFLIWMNGVRQCIVVCFFVLLSRSILKREVIWYFVGVILASYIHKSALFLLPLFFVTYVPIKWFYNGKRNLFILLICFIVGLSPIWLEHVTAFRIILEKIGYVSYGLEISELVSDDNLEATAMGPGRMMLLFLDVILIVVYPKVSDYFRNRYIDQCFIFYFSGTCLYNLLVNTSHLFLRPVSYFTVFIVVVLAATLVYLKRKKVRWKYYSLSCLAYIYVLYTVFRAWYLVGANSTDLYHLFFL